jgi:branched-chain amino acid transport system substrate-binding protein
MWNQLETNRNVGGSVPERCRWQRLGRSGRGLPAAAGRDELQPHRSGPLREPAGRFLGADLGLPRGGCDIITGVVLPPDFATFWTQAAQQGFRPKVASIGKAILFPSAVNAIGPAAQNLSSEVWWSNVHPFTSSITGASAGEVCEGFEQATGRQWTQPLGFVHALFEVLVDVLKRESDIRDADAVAAAIAATDLDTIVGPIRWDGANLPPFAQKNVTKTPLVGGQWRMSDDGLFRLAIVDNQTYPDIPLTGDMEAIG